MYVQRYSYGHLNVPCYLVYRFETIIKFPDDFFPHFSIYEHVRDDYPIVEFEATDKLNNPVDRLEYTLTNLDGTPSEEFAIAENEDLTARIYTLAVVQVHKMIISAA